jgi:hypothetical protein
LAGGEQRLADQLRKPGIVVTAYPEQGEGQIELGLHQPRPCPHPGAALHGATQVVKALVDMSEMQGGQAERPGDGPPRRSSHPIGTNRSA